VDALERNTETVSDQPVWTPTPRLPAGRSPRAHVRRRVDLQWKPGDIREGQFSDAILRRDAFYRRYLALSDVVAAYAATAAAVAASGQGASYWALAGAPLVVLLCKVLGLYDRDESLVHKTTLDEAPQLFQVATIFTLTTWIAHNSFVTDTFTTTAGGILWPLTMVLLLASRTAARRIARRVTKPERCIVVGDSISASHLKTAFDRSSTANAVILGRVPAAYGNRRGEDPWGAVLPSTVPFLGDIDVLSGILKSHQVERVLIAPTAGATDDLLEMIRAVKASGVKVSVVPRLFEVIGSSASFDDVEGTMLLGIRRYGLTRSSQLTKRALDVAVAVTTLVVLSPVLAVMAVAIRLDTPGPVFFRQRRIGQGGREFEMIKFRTMVEDAERRQLALAPLNEANGLFKIADDPRITRVGRLLRRTYLDEVPQLLNVLRGDMSLVGPRPLVPADDSRVHGWSRRRLHVLPGMTGHWQILGSSRVPLGEMVKIDYLYGANWSLWGDLKVLLRTVPSVLARRGQ
jgi:exopolysaccharide biosynthesis polyprenyl glycosylphosphotransferase